VTDIVLEWVSGTSPNYGILIKANNTVGINTLKEFINNDPVKKPALFYVNLAQKYTKSKSDL